jgi:hypothetical protein
MHATERACGNVMRQHDPHAVGERGDGSKRQFDGIGAEVHRYPDPGEERGSPLVEAGAAERGVESLSFEVDRYENQRRRNLDLEIVEPAALPFLATGLIHLEDADVCHEFAAAVRKRVEARSENHVLANSGSDRPLNRIFNEASSQRGPAAEAEQLRLREFGTQTVGDRRARVAPSGNARSSRKTWGSAAIPWFAQYSDPRPGYPTAAVKAGGCGSLALDLASLRESRARESGGSANAAQRCPTRSRTSAVPLVRPRASVLVAGRMVAIVAYSAQAGGLNTDQSDQSSCE